MNRLFFFCEECKVFSDAGYRRGLSALVACGVISEERLDQDSFVPLEGPSVLECPQYWDAPSGESLTASGVTRVFIERHRSHPLSLGDIHRLTRHNEWPDWLIDEEGAETLPRYFIEKLGLRKWSDVEEHVSRMRYRPWWWGAEPLGENRAVARRRFEELAQQSGP